MVLLTGCAASNGPDAGHSGSGGGSAAVDGGRSDAGHDAGHLEVDEDGGLPHGALCNQPSDCATRVCVSARADLPTICTKPCSSQSECEVFPDWVCLPDFRDGGNAGGLCAPRFNPNHCASCASDTECDLLSAACTPTPDDPSPHCHVDCSLAGQVACPDEYGCAPVQTAQGSRMLCVPIDAPCDDSNGGDCVRRAETQACDRSSDAGSCTGIRYCDPDAGRFLACNATAPACKTSCADVDPPHCQNVFCAQTLTSVLNCGGCGMKCPGFGQSTGAATCRLGECNFVCQGERYDVDGNPANGCEVSDGPGDHTSATAIGLGHQSCDDAMPFTTTGKIASDLRLHQNPPIAAFDLATGSAPDVFTLQATGGLCVDDLEVSLNVSNSGSPGCYALTVLTDQQILTCQTDPATGACQLSAGAGAYSSGTEVRFAVQKTCDKAVLVETVSYVVTGHL